MIRVIFCLLLLALVPVAAASLPDANTIAHDVGETSVDHAWLLAYTTRESTNLYIEDALILTQAGPQWTLSYAFRHPREDEPRGWHLSVVYDAPVSPRHTYSHRPTLPEVETFLKDSWWKRTSATEYKRGPFDTFPETWRKVLGYPPPADLTPR